MVRLNEIVQLYLLAEGVGFGINFLQLGNMSPDGATLAGS